MVSKYNLVYNSNVDSKQHHSEACGQPLKELLDLLSGPWTLQILWILKEGGQMRFSELKRRLGGISSRVLTERLKMLVEAEILFRHYEPTIPPEVSYRLCSETRGLVSALDQLDAFAKLRARRRTAVRNG